VFRSKYRNSYSNPEPLVPDQPTKIEFSLRDRFHRFLKGHRIMVQIQSSWFPVIDRNPQKFMDIYKAKESDFQKATNRMYRSGNLLSSIIVNVIK
jgi:predicted acyl esterase